MLQMAPASATYQPRQKVIAAAGGSGVASALAVLAIWGLRSAGLALPPEVEGALSTVLVAAITFLAGYLTPPGAAETTVHVSGGTVRCAIRVAPDEAAR